MHLTARQRAVLEYIKDHVDGKGFPPTVREVAAHFGFASPLSAQMHINALVKKGFLRKSPYKQRTLEIPGFRPSGSTRIPLIKKISSNIPSILFDAGDIETYINIDKGLFNVAGGFVLRVTDDSMINAGIFEGDMALINPHIVPKDGDIAAVLIMEKVIMKRFYKEKNRIRLVSDNKQIKPITLHTRYASIIGKVVGMFRKL